jgi:protein-S-isoprenylcysteine O-methyltransferase Ste14
MTGSQFNKALVSAAIGVLGWVAVVLASDAAEITNTEWAQLIAVVLATAGVFGVKNAPKPPA